MKPMLTPAIVAMAVLAWLGCSPSASAQNTQVTVMAVVPSKSGSNSALQKARPEALKLAARNAWLIYKKRPDFQDLMRGFMRAQDDLIVQEIALFEQGSLCEQPLDIDQVYDKKLAQIAFRFRLSCSMQDLLQTARNIQSQMAASGNGPSVGSASAPSSTGKLKMAGFFVALKYTSMEEFKATQKDYSVENDSQSTRGQYSSDLEKDGSVDVQRRQAEKTAYGETYGGKKNTIFEDTKSRDQQKVKEVEKVRASESSDISVTNSRSAESGGSTVTRAATVTRQIVDAQAIQAALSEKIQSENRYSWTPYGNIAAPCRAPRFTEIQELVRNLPADAALAVPDDKRTEMAQALRSCTDFGPFRFYVEGYAKIGPPQRLGSVVRITVYMSQKVMDLNDFSEASVVKELQVEGEGSDELQAQSAALANAARKVADMTLTNLMAKGL